MSLPGQVDFLPAEYRQRQVRRQWVSRRIGVVLAFVALGCGLGFSQFYGRYKVRRALAAVGPVYERAMQQQAELAAVQAKLQAAQAEAELYTYLRHPWPRSQLLAALLASLPAGVTFQELRLVREATKTQEVGDRLAPGARQAEEQQLAKLAPATRDLKRLRQKIDRSTVLLTLSGATSDNGRLHTYLGKLDRSELFSRAELLSIDAGTGEDGHKLRFSALLFVRPGYGQPGGPSVPKPPAAQLSQASPTAGGAP